MLFSSARLDAASCVQVPTEAQPELYAVPVAGGMPTQVLTTPAFYAVHDRAGARLAYSDQKGYENAWRKHDTSSFARDVWVLDVATGEHTRLTEPGWDDRQPVWAPSDGALYVLSERSGSFNVWRLGYVHIRGMSDGPFREVIEDAFGEEVAKEGLVLDTRFNGGGNLVEPLTVFLSGRTYMSASPRGQTIGSEPTLRWTKPSVVVQNEGNYSDAHCFPYAYRTLGIGELVGSQVPGTCTAVWWETLQDRSLYFGMPQVTWVDLDGDPLENKHLDPDHAIDNDPKLEAAGRDQQLEKAVEVLLGAL